MRKTPSLLFVVLAVLFGAQAVLVVSRSDAPVAAPAPEPTPSATTVPSDTLTPTDEPTPTPAPTEDARIAAGLGAWVDTYDFPKLDAERTVALLVKHGVRTLYLQTGRFRSTSDIAPEVADWLPAAKGAGLRVVGWYLPDYADVDRDVRRTVAIGTYEAGGARFDAIGIDIEHKDGVPDTDTWNERVLAHAARVARAVELPLMMITLPPIDMAVAPDRWRGFPWRGLAEYAFGWVLMAYWSNRDCPDVAVHCPEAYAVGNDAQLRQLTGKPGLPVHLAGGIADRVSDAEVEAFIRGVNRSEAIGVSLYDVQTTRASQWPLLEAFSP